MTVTCRSDRPARSRHAVAFCCDANYLPYAAFAADRIARQAPELDVLICATEPLEVPQALGLRQCVIGAEGLFDGFGLDERRTLATYLRLTLPDALHEDYDRILYLDADIHVQGGDFAALVKADLKGRPAAAVRDNQQWRSPSRHPADLKSLGLPNAPYFNAGVLLIDVPGWRRDNLLRRALDFGADHAGRMTHKDQTLLNATLHSNWAELSPVWNWQYTRSSRLFEAMADANIVHFIGPVKPWADPTGKLPARFARELATFMKTHFPDLPMPVPSRGPLAIKGAARALAWRHLLGAERTARYLSRFPDELTVYA